jgi:preprotein translocase subunit SecY
MIANIKNILKIEDLRNKILFTLMIVGLYRVGAAIRVPGVDPLAIEQLRAGAQDGALGLFNLFSGGAFESFSVFALGIMPYITASIIMQILGVVIPKLEELQQQGAVGQRKITQYTRYVTVTLALLQATVLVFLFGNGGGGAFYSAVQAPSVPLLPDGIWPRGYLIIPTLVVGTAVLMWFGELISQRGIGNGMSMVIFASVVAGIPSGFYSILLQNKVFWFVMMVLLSVAIIAAVVYVELGQRRIPVQFAKRVVGRRMMGG